MPRGPGPDGESTVYRRSILQMTGVMLDRHEAAPMTMTAKQTAWQRAAASLDLPASARPIEIRFAR